MKNMAISRVDLDSDAYLVCLTHAMSTEREEIMGLLIGEVDERKVSHISAVIMLRRSDKQPDRVEISPEQLSAASTQAERLAQELKRPMRVVGWYHSHPHITVWPSHVDVRTQAMYQLMDEGFVGLIFSVFNEEKSSKQCKIQVTCFQSVNHSPEGEPPQFARLEIPLHIVRKDCIGEACMESMVELPTILSMEEEEAYKRASSGCDLDFISKIHNASVYSKSLCHIMDVMSGPLLHSLENRLHNNMTRIEELIREKKRLTEQLNTAVPHPPRVRTRSRSTEV